MTNSITFVKNCMCIIACISIAMATLVGCNGIGGIPAETTPGYNQAEHEDNTNNGGIPTEMTPGYYQAEYEGNTNNGAAFLACGTGGRMDRIFEDGMVESVSLPVGDKNLTSLLIGDGVTLVGGFSGALAYSFNGEEFHEASGVGNENITGLVQFKEKYYACTNSGNVLSSADGVSWSVGERVTNKQILGIAAVKDYIIAITEDTDILKSKDGVSWDTQNYNADYYGLAEQQSFRNIVNLDRIVYILGRSLENPDAPAVMYTNDADSWMYVASMELNNRPPEEFYPLTIYSVRFFGDLILAACDRGRVLAFTDCPSCNEIMDVNSVDLRCVAVSGDIVLVAGDDFEFSVLSAEDLQDLSSNLDRR
ncbi:hypothetical protein FACS1894127_2500 [Clostridia bacterium]|nr:hypothetical protein FACS1894127_2500 [Clostridia bacterium]